MITYSWSEVLDQTATYLLDGDIDEAKRKIARILASDSDAPASVKVEAQLYLRHAENYQLLTDIYSRAQSDQIEELQQAQKDIRLAKEQHKLSFAINKKYVKGQEQRKSLDELLSKTGDAIEGKQFNSVAAKLDLIANDLRNSVPEERALDDIRARLASVETSLDSEPVKLTEAHTADIKNRIADCAAQADELQAKLKATAQLVEQANRSLREKNFDQYGELVKKLAGPNILGDLPEARTVVRQLTERLGLRQSIEAQLAEIGKTVEAEPTKALAQLSPLKTKLVDLGLPNLTAVYDDLTHQAEKKAEANRRQAQELLQQGQAEFEAKQWAAAVETLKQARKLDPQSKEIEIFSSEAEAKSEQYYTYLGRVNSAVKEGLTSDFSSSKNLKTSLNLLVGLGININELQDTWNRADESARIASINSSSVLMGTVESIPLTAERWLRILSEKVDVEERAVHMDKYRKAFVQESTLKLRNYLSLEGLPSEDTLREFVDQNEGVSINRLMENRQFSVIVVKCEKAISLWRRLSDEQTWKEIEKPGTLLARARIVEQQQKNAAEADKWWQGVDGQAVARAETLEGDALTPDSGFAALDDLKKALNTFENLSSGARYMLGERETQAAAVNVRGAIRGTTRRIGSFLLNWLNNSLDNQYQTVQRMLENDQERDALQLCEGLESQSKRLSKIFSFIEQEYPDINKEKRDWGEPLKQSRLRAEKASLGRQKLKEAAELLRDAKGEQALAAIETAKEGVLSLNSKAEVATLEKEAERLRTAVRAVFDMRARRLLEPELEAVRAVLSLAPGAGDFNDRSKELEKLIGDQKAIDLEIDRQKGMLLQYSDYETALRWCEQQLTNPEYKDYKPLKELLAEATRIKGNTEQFRNQIAAVKELIKKGSAASAIQTADVLLRDPRFTSMPALDRDELTALRQNAKEGDEALRAARQSLDEALKLAGNKSNADGLALITEKLDKVQEKLEVVSACGMGGSDYDTQKKRLTQMRGAEKGLKEAEDLLRRGNSDAKYQALRKLAELRSGDLSIADRQRVDARYEEVARQVEDIVLRGKADEATERDVQEAQLGLDALEKLGRGNDEDKQELMRRREILNAGKLIGRAASADMRRAAQTLSAYIEAGRTGYRIEDVRRDLTYAAARGEAEDLEKSSSKDWGRIAALYQEAHTIRPDQGLNQKAREAQISACISLAKTALADLNPASAERALQASPSRTEMVIETAEAAKSLRVALENAQAAVREPSLERISAAMKTLEDRLKQNQLGATGMEAYGALRDQAVDKLIALAGVGDEDGEEDEWRTAKIYQAACAIRPEREELANKKRAADRQARAKTDTLVDDLDKANDNPNLTAAECKRLMDRLEKMPGEALKASVSLREARLWLVERRKQIEKADQLLKQARAEIKSAIGDGKFDKPENSLDELCALNDRLFGDREEVRQLRKDLADHKRRRALAHTTLAEYTQAKAALAKQITSAAMITKPLVEQSTSGARRGFEVALQKARDLKEADPAGEYHTRSMPEGRKDILDVEVGALGDIRGEVDSAKRKLLEILDLKDGAQKSLDECAEKYDKAQSAKDDQSAIGKAEETIAKVMDSQRLGNELASHCAAAEQTAHDINMDGPGVAAWLSQASSILMKELKEINDKAREQKSKADTRIGQTESDLAILKQYHDDPRRSYEEAQLGLSAGKNILEKRPADGQVKTMMTVLDNVKPPGIPVWVKAALIVFFVVVISIVVFLLFTETGRRMLGLMN